MQYSDLPPSLIIGGASTALAAYTFFVIFPVSSSNMTQASSQMRIVGNNVYNLASKIPCSDFGGCKIAGVTLLDFSGVKASVMNVGNTVGSLSDSIASFRDTLFYGLLTLMGLGVATVISGIGLAAAGAALKDLRRYRVTLKQ